MFNIEFAGRGYLADMREVFNFACDTPTKGTQDFRKNLAAPHQRPQDIHFARSPPKAISGKMRRVEPRENR